MPWGLISGFLVVHALLTLIMVPYAKWSPLVGGLIQGYGWCLCFIKALLSPDICTVSNVYYKEVGRKSAEFQGFRAEECQYNFFFLFLNLKKCPWKNRGYCIWNVQSAGTLQIPVLFCILNLAQPSHVYTPFVFLPPPPPQKWNPILENIVFYSCIVKKCKSITETRVFA